MTAKPKEGTIISVKDFIDMIVYYLMPPTTEYKDKITVVTHTGFRMIVKKNCHMGMINATGTYMEKPNQSNTRDGWANGQQLWDMVASDLRPTSNHTPDLDNHKTYIPKYYTGVGLPQPFGNSPVSKIIDPADNTTYEGVDKHKIAGTMPVAGELISVEDIENMLNATGATIYKWTIVVVHDWTNRSFENRPDHTPDWDPNNDGTAGGPGWEQVNAWQYIRLNTPFSTLYSTSIPANLKFKETDYISPEHIQTVAEHMYLIGAGNNAQYETIHVLSCHNNCHHNCHCHRW